MKRNKYYTNHAQQRLKERGKPTGLFNLTDKKICIIALKNGKKINDLPNGDLKEYLKRRVAKDNKRIRVYKNYVFIYFINSNRLITCYPLPKKFLK